MLLVCCGELGSRLFNTTQCQPIKPQPGNWKTMIGDRELLWKLEPNAQVKMGDDVSKISSIGLREKLLL